MGDKERAFVYYKHARRELEHLFDTSDYSVAEALFGTPNPDLSTNEESQNVMLTLILRIARFDVHRVRQWFNEKSALLHNPCHADM